MSHHKDNNSSSIKGPAIFLAQFADDQPPFNSLNSICEWAAGLGYKGIQIPTTDARLFDLDKAANSSTYVDEVKGICADHDIQITELSTHLQGQLVAVHPAYDAQFDAFAPEAVHGDPKARQAWAVEQMQLAAKASANFDLKTCVSFTGSLAFPYLYPWPQRPAGLIDEAFTELAKRWKPILDTFKDQGVGVAYEIHPGEDVFDGATFERFLDHVDNHDSCQILYDPSHFLLQQLDYLAFIDIYHERITAMHVKDAEFTPSGRQGVYSGYESWLNRAARFRSLGDGQIDFGGIFSKMTQYGFDSWAVLEWECCLKNSDDGAREGAEFIKRHLIKRPERDFDDFAGGKHDQAALQTMLGLTR